MTYLDSKDFLNLNNTKKKLAKENIVSNFVFYLIKFKAFVFSLEHTETSYSKWLKIQLK